MPLGTYKNFLQQKIRDLKEKNLFKQLKNSNFSQPKIITYLGKKMLNFASNDYLGLNSSPNNHLINKIAKTPMSSSSSRLISGQYHSINTLEQEISQWKNKEACIVFPSGFQANLSILPCILSRNLLAFSDRLVHASIIDGITLSQAKHYRFKHNNTQHLEELLKKYSKKDENTQKIIVSESLFSMQGDYSNINELARLAKKYNCLLYIDEAHSSGFIELKDKFPQAYEKIDFLLGTFGKALAGQGAYLACSKLTKDYFVNKARGFIYSTAPSPIITQINLYNTKIIQSQKMEKKREHLKNLILYFQKKLIQTSYSTTHSELSPIIPIEVKTEKNALKLQEKFLTNNIFCLAIRPPTVPKNSCILRVSINASHTYKDIDKLIKVLA